MKKGRKSTKKPPPNITSNTVFVNLTSFESNIVTSFSTIFSTFQLFSAANPNHFSIHPHRLYRIMSSACVFNISHYLLNFNINLLIFNKYFLINNKSR